MKLLYAMIKKIKVAPIIKMVDLLGLITSFSTSISCTSLVTRIANGVGALEDQNIPYLATPRLIIDLHCLLQGHHLKHNEAKEIVHFFQGMQTKSGYLTRNFICIIPDHSPSLLTNKRKSQGDLCLAG
jgi:hypothetical protein